MRRLFDITPRPTTLEIAQRGSGRVGFTVTNTTEKSLRVRPLLQLEEKSPDEGWIDIEDASIFQLDEKNGTAEVWVKVNIPATAAEGDYLFRLRILSIDNPDDDWTDSSLVTIRVRKAAPVEEPKKIPWPLIIAGAAVLLIAVGVAIYFARKPSVAMAGEPCGDKGCEDSATCQTNFEGDKVCLFDKDKACQAHRECATAFCQNNVCAEAVARLECTKDDECALMQTCTSPSNQNKRFCLLKDGQACTIDGVCASLFCREGKQCAQLPALCQTNSDCYANHTCRAQMCLANNGQPCTIDQNCLSGFCTDGDRRKVCSDAPANRCPPCNILEYCNTRTGRCESRRTATEVNTSVSNTIRETILKNEAILKQTTTPVFDRSGAVKR